VKIVATSDWHGDVTTHGIRRFPEIAEAVNATVDRAIEEDADAYVFLGDLCNPDSGSCVFRVVRLAIEAETRLALRKIPSIWVAGNHDVIEDGSGESALSPLRGLGDAMVTVCEAPEELTLFGRNGGPATRFVVLPFTPTTHPYDPAGFVRSIRGADVVLSHLTEISGVEPGEEAKEMPRGRGIRLPVEDLKGAKVILNGHFHRRQKYGPIWIPGSLARLTFCEERHDPGYLVVDV